MRIEIWPSETIPAIGTSRASLTFAEELGQVGLPRREQAAGQQDLAAEHVSDDPEILVAGVGLEPVDGQDHPAGLGRDRLEPGGVRARQGRQFVVAIQGVADVPLADCDAAADQLGVDLRDAAVLGVAGSADQGDDVEAALVLRQDIPPLRLGSEANAMARALRVAAAADLEPEPDQALEGDDGPLRLVGGPEPPAAGGTIPDGRGPIQGPLGRGWDAPSRQRATPRSGDRPRSNKIEAINQPTLPSLEKVASSRGRRRRGAGPRA